MLLWRAKPKPERTITWKPHHALGGGVVADSDPEAEFQESCNKARALIRAAEEAVRFARSSQ